MEKYTLDEFYIQNYRSFYSQQTLQLAEAKPVTAFYGPNASGKTNLFRALTIFCHFVRRSTDPNITGTPHSPFLLRSNNNSKPSIFGVKFHQGLKKYEYRFSVLESRVEDEEMYDLSSSRPRLIFKRSAGPSETFTRNGFNKKLFEGPESVREDSLLITLAQRTKNPYANAVFGLISSLRTFTLTDIGGMLGDVAEMLQKKPELAQQVVEILKKADFSIKDFTYNVSKITAEMLSGAPLSEAVKDELIQIGKNISINTIHTVRDEMGDKVDSITFNMDRQESLGTRIFFNLAVAVLNTINSGETLYIDEFGASLHTSLCIFIINLFKSKRNSTGARLIINTHDTGLLKNGVVGTLDKDDVMIIEKDRFEQSIITPLNTLVKRSDENIHKKYTMGIYGGIPILEEAV